MLAITLAILSPDVTAHAQSAASKSAIVGSWGWGYSDGKLVQWVAFYADGKVASHWNGNSQVGQGKWKYSKTTERYYVTWNDYDPEDFTVSDDDQTLSIVTPKGRINRKRVSPPEQ